MMLKNFNELCLRLFGNMKSTENYYIPVGGIPDSVVGGVEDGRWTVTYEEMKSIVTPTIDDIISLVRGEIQGVEKKGLIVSVRYFSDP